MDDSISLPSPSPSSLFSHTKKETSFNSAGITFPSFPPSKKNFTVFYSF